MDKFSENLQMQLLDFDEEKRKIWEKNRQPYAAHIELTPRCNFNCVHCYLQKHHIEAEMSYKKIIEILDILHEKGILFITLTGGEIFTRKDFTDIYLYAKQKGFLIELFTNGTALNEQLIELFKKYPPLLIDVSIYGGCEKTYQKITGVSGAFDKVITNCRKLVDAKIRLSLKSPIMNETYDEIVAMQAIADEIGAPICFSFEICSTVDGDSCTLEHQVPLKKMLKYEFDDAIRTKNKTEESRGIIQNNVEFVKQGLRPLFRCKIGLNSFIIDYQGNMCPCMKFKHKGIKLTKNNFDKIWEEFGAYRKMYISDRCKCSSCKMIDYCEVCPAEMDFLYNDFEYRPSAACKYAEARTMFYKGQKNTEQILNEFDG